MSACIPTPLDYRHLAKAGFLKPEQIHVQAPWLVTALDPGSLMLLKRLPFQVVVMGCGDEPDPSHCGRPQ